MRLAQTQHATYAIAENGDLWAMGSLHVQTTGAYDAIYPKKIMSDAVSVATIDSNGALFVLKSDGSVYRSGMYLFYEGIANENMNLIYDIYGFAKYPVKMADNAVYIDAANYNGFAWGLFIIDNKDTLWFTGIKHTEKDVLKGEYYIPNLTEVSNNVKKAIFANAGSFEGEFILKKDNSLWYSGHSYKDDVYITEPIKIADDAIDIVKLNTETIFQRSDGKWYEVDDSNLGATRKLSYSQYSRSDNILPRGTKGFSEVPNGTGFWTGYDFIIKDSGFYDANSITDITVTGGGNTAFLYAGDVYTKGNNDWGQIGNGLIANGNNYLTGEYIEEPIKVLTRTSNGGFEPIFKEPEVKTDRQYINSPHYHEVTVEQIDKMYDAKIPFLAVCYSYSCIIQVFHRADLPPLLEEMNVPLLGISSDTSPKFENAAGYRDTPVYLGEFVLYDGQTVRHFAGGDFDTLNMLLNSLGSIKLSDGSGYAESTDTPDTIYLKDNDIYPEGFRLGRAINYSENMSSADFYLFIMKFMEAYTKKLGVLLVDESGIGSSNVKLDDVYSVMRAWDIAPAKDDEQSVYSAVPKTDAIYALSSMMRFLDINIHNIEQFISIEGETLTIGECITALANIGRSLNIINAGVPLDLQANNAGDIQTPANTVIDAAAFERKVFELVNFEREKQGINPLIWNDQLAAVARTHSVDMAQRGFVDHISPDGLSPFDRMDNAGIVYQSAAENIAEGQRTPQEVVEKWMNASGHRANILDASYTHIGVGFYNYNWTQNFMSVE
jgi:uncharacterized protein YkwD